MLLAALVCIIGLLLFLWAANAKAIEIGKIMFAAGLLVFLLHADRIVALVNSFAH